MIQEFALLPESTRRSQSAEENWRDLTSYIQRHRRSLGRLEAENERERQEEEREW